MILIAFVALYGAARGGGRNPVTAAKAKRYFTQLFELAGKGDPRPEIEQAKAFLAKN